ncbi:unnamed protein product [Anisakis simplex]|uniref:Mitochondrial import inner membrane translocase subunit tim-16 n=1 Tax=Anisakis simplex TaxID=6269 RepID=A0A0M3JE92_ANISI|nr:unnamed protein product [Anisakis simplex]
MVWRNAAKVILAAGEALTKAFTRAVRDEIRASKQAAARYAERTGGSASEAQRSGETNARLGISLQASRRIHSVKSDLVPYFRTDKASLFQESMQILNVKEPLNKEEVESHYKHLFEINDKTKGGSLYLQSKVSVTFYIPFIKHSSCSLYSSANCEQYYSYIN